MRTVTGTVTSNKMNKTIVITVDSYRTHEKYHKKYKVSSKFYAHDEKGQYKIGDTVTAYETKPISKLKRWTVTPPTVTTTK